MVSISSHPFKLSFAVCFMMISLVIFFNFGFSFLFFLSEVFMIFSMLVWSMDTLKESFLGYHNFFVKDNLKLGFSMFIFSEVMFFLGFFWAFFDMSLVPNTELGMVWSPLGVFSMNPFDLPLLNTSILLSSGVTCTWAHYYILENKNNLVPLCMTLALGLFFTYIQILEYSISSFTITDGAFGTSFFVTTGFHGLHVLIGTFLLLVCAFRTLISSYSTLQHVGFEASIWYWHFVDVVWIFLYFFVYFWAF